MIKKFFIGDLAKKTGLVVRTIRYYESVGLLPKTARTESGYRVYGDDAVDRLEFIIKAKSIGLKIREIRDVVTLIDKGLVPCGFTKTLISSKIDEIDEKLAELYLLKSKLASLLELCEKNPEIMGSCPVIESLEKKP
jgi:MerR family copper efflux transcriptional regulator